MKADEVHDGSDERLQPDVKTETLAQKQTIVSVDLEHRDGCAQLSETSERWTSLSTSHDERIMTAIARRNAKARCKAIVVRREILFSD